MLSSDRVVTCLVLFGTIFATADARQWSDTTGNYTVEADLVGFDDESVILQRENKELGSFPIEKLSEEDREYLKSREATEIHADKLGQLQTWTTRNGVNIVGRIVDYARRKVSVQRRRGKTYVDNTVFDNLPEVYQRMMPAMIQHFEGVEMPNTEAFEKWVRALRGIPKSYQVDGVVMELENGDEYEVPFFIFSDEDQNILKPGWNAWLSDHDDYDKRDDHAFQLQAQAAAYQRDKEVDRQIAVMNLNMQAIQAGLTSAWEVTLYPGPGTPGPPRWVVTMGRNSQVATQIALQQNPGYVSGSVRKVSRR